MVFAAALLALASTACVPSVQAPATPCPDLAGWPPAGLPTPPLSVAVVHPPGGAVKVRYRVWTPLDCGASPSFSLDDGAVIPPGKLVEWSGDDPVPVAGPVLGGVEVWTHPCDEACPDPPDFFISFERAPPR